MVNIWFRITLYKITPSLISLRIALTNGTENVWLLQYNHILICKYFSSICFVHWLCCCTKAGSHSFWHSIFCYCGKEWKKGRNFVRDFLGSKCYELGQSFIYIMKNKNWLQYYNIEIHSISINIKTILLAIDRNTVIRHPRRSFFAVYLHTEIPVEVMKCKYDFVKSAVVSIFWWEIMALNSKEKLITENLKFWKQRSLDHGISTLPTNVRRNIKKHNL